MKHHNFLKSLSLALLVAGCPLHNAVAESHCQLQPSAIIENVQEEEKQEKIQMPPHTVHVGAGYSYIISNIYAGGLDVDKLKHGAGVELSYTYLPVGKRLGFGVNYTAHFSRVTATEGPSWQAYWANINMQLHNITPTLNICNVYRKHALKTSLGIGYMFVRIGGLGSAIPNGAKETKDGLSGYLSFEYEYRIDEYTGFFMRIHETGWVSRYDEENEMRDGILDCGVSIGFNIHF